MARLGDVRRHTSSAAIITLAAVALLSALAIMSVRVYAESTT
jgi:hypothetical protein